MSQNALAVEADLRVRRTRQLLQDAFMALVVEVGFDAITIQLLAERAMVNRATFYRHYQDKFDLAEQLYAALTAEYQASVAGFAVTDPLRGWEQLFDHIARYAEVYRALLVGVPDFREYICRNIEQELLAALVQMGFVPEPSTLPVPLALRYLATSQMGIIQWWLETGQSISTTQMAHYLWQMHTQGAMYLLQLPASGPQSSAKGE